MPESTYNGYGNGNSPEYSERRGGNGGILKNNLVLSQKGDSTAKKSQNAYDNLKTELQESKNLSTSSNADKEPIPAERLTFSNMKESAFVIGKQKSQGHIFIPHKGQQSQGLMQNSSEQVLKKISLVPASKTKI